MGLATQIGYRIGPANRLQRLVQAVASTRGGAWLFSRTLRHLDDVIARLTGGRQSAPGLLAGLPVLDLTTTGRRTGARRTSRLIAVPVGDDLAVLGTNFGQPATPAWALNLEADPHAVVTFRGRSVPVVARPADDAESEEVLRRAATVYGGYAAYRRRITGRRVRMFVLEPLHR